MRYRTLLLVFFFLLIANTGFTQNSGQPAIAQSVVAVNLDTSDVNTQLHMFDIKNKSFSNSGVYFGMPIIYPRYSNAKMNYWWPSTDYDYNMPNAISEKENSFQLRNPRQDN